MISEETKEIQNKAEREARAKKWAYFLALPLTYIFFSWLFIDSDSPDSAWFPILLISAAMTLFPTIALGPLFYWWFSRNDNR